MTFSIRFAARAVRGLARIADFNRATGAGQATAVIRLISAAIRMLAEHPFIGRPAGGYRELVISHGKTGYVALYSVDVGRGLVSVLAIRHQRESGFGP